MAQTRRAAFLHDIGKVMTSDIEGPHHIIGADFIKRFGEVPEKTMLVRSPMFAPASTGATSLTAATDSPVRADSST